MNFVLIVLCTLLGKLLLGLGTLPLNRSLATVRRSWFACGSPVWSSPTRGILEIR